MPLIDVENVCYRPDGVPVLQQVSLRSDARRIGIVGRNGSGKTSLARVLAGLVGADAGRVQIAGVDVMRDRRAALTVVGILFQNPDHQIIFPTVEEEIGFGLRQMGQSDPEVRETTRAILHQFDRPDWAEVAVHTLSHGQRQLVCLMAVLAMGPRVIILDEPFAGLDIPTALGLGRVLDGLEQTIIQITHDPAVLRGYDQVVWLDQGAVRAEGPPDTVLPEFETRMQALGAAGAPDMPAGGA